MAQSKKSKLSLSNIKRELKFFYQYDIHYAIIRLRAPFMQAQCLHKDCDECDTLRAFTTIGGTTDANGNWGHIRYFQWKDQVFADVHEERESVIRELNEQFQQDTERMVKLSEVVDVIKQYWEEEDHGSSKL